MPRTAVLDVAKEIDGIQIYSDLAHLPDSEAVKKSQTRSRNQRTKALKAEGGSDGEKKARKPRAASAGAIRKSGALPVPDEAKPIMTRHTSELKAHDDHHAELIRTHGAGRKELEAKHESEIVRVRELIAFIQMGDKIGGASGSHDLTAAARRELASIK